VYVLNLWHLTNFTSYLNFIYHVKCRQSCIWSANKICMVCRICETSQILLICTLFWVINHVFKTGVWLLMTETYSSVDGSNRVVLLDGTRLTVNTVWVPQRDKKINYLLVRIPICLFSRHFIPPNLKFSPQHPQSVFLPQNDRRSFKLFGGYFSAPSNAATSRTTCSDEQHRC
jgi:hypothetical protein